MITLDKISDLINLAIEKDVVRVEADVLLDLTNGYSAWEHCMKKLKGHVCPVKCWTEDCGYEALDMKCVGKNIGWLMR